MFIGIQWDIAGSYYPYKKNYGVTWSMEVNHQLQHWGPRRRPSLFVISLIQFLDTHFDPCRCPNSKWWFYKSYISYIPLLLFWDLTRRISNSGFMGETNVWMWLKLKCDSPTSWSTSQKKEIHALKLGVWCDQLLIPGWIGWIIESWITMAQWLNMRVAIMAYCHGTSNKVLRLLRLR
jgi:hypothetical protein